MKWILCWKLERIRINIIRNIVKTSILWNVYSLYTSYTAAMQVQFLKVSNTDVSTNLTVGLFQVLLVAVQCVLQLCDLSKAGLVLVFADLEGFTKRLQSGLCVCGQFLSLQ